MFKTDTLDSRREVKILGQLVLKVGAKVVTG